MKVTKFAHSCLYIETEQRAGIIDPGDLSFNSGSFKPDAIQRLDDIMITHEHPDHMHIPFIKVLLKKFPQAQIITNPAAATVLAAEGITATTSNTPAVELFGASHETMVPLGQPPANTGIHYLQQLSHPGDCHHFSETMEILALPITAPWGTLARAAELGVELRPQSIIPIHDWHLNEQARQGFYERLDKFFQEKGIRFIKPVDGQPFEV